MPDRIQTKKKPWPTKKAMEQVYEMKLWGDNEAEFYSGIGSHHPDIIHPYIEAGTSFLKSFKNPITVCDLGCGDFNVGKELLKYVRKYIAIDIVPDLIEYNQKRFIDKQLEFRCLDISKDPVPPADCVFVRQVLQHLSNTEVVEILEKLIKYKYVILTEHIPEGDFIPNIDIISGQGTRLKKRSGIDLLAPPFNFKIREKRKLVTVNSNDGNGVIVTVLYKMF